MRYTIPIFSFLLSYIIKSGTTRIFLPLLSLYFSEIINSWKWSTFIKIFSTAEYSDLMICLNWVLEILSRTKQTSLFFVTSYDNRKGSRFNADPEWNGTVSFRLEENEDFSNLTLKPVRRSHQGLYRCRVDFKYSRARFYFVNLIVIGKLASLVSLLLVIVNCWIRGCESYI